MSFSIREATPGDTPVILHLIRQLAIYEKLEDAVTATEEMLHEQLFERHCAKVLIGEEDGRPVGFALYFFNFSTFLAKPGLYLEDLFVEPEYRGKGYGKALLTALAGIAKERNCGRMEWSVLDWNSAAIAFYKSLNAVPMEEWTVFRLDDRAIDQMAANR